MRNATSALLLLLTCSLASAPSFSAQYTCTGLVIDLALNPAGLVQANTGYGNHYLCSIGSVFNGITPEVCKAWYSMLTTAKVTGATVTQWYDTTQGTALNCSQLQNWAAPSPIPYRIRAD